MGLQRYRDRRNFEHTAEPRGQARHTRGNSFVVQKHAARALHYDFRLELDGVLLSWAVPKGPSLDPHVKRLAVQTEDHPIEYGGFEGTIPKGDYGGGSVIVWDRGTWTPEGNAQKDYARGRLNFRLDGEKLKGRFHLVRTARGKGRKNDWLLFKGTDAEARPGSGGELVESRPESVLSGRSVEAVADAPGRVWHSKKATEAPSRHGSSNGSHGPSLKSYPGARRAALPEFVEPELATLVDAAPTGNEFLHEIKLDGYRILARVDKGRVTLQSRRGVDWSPRMPSVARAVAALPVGSAILDGEVVVFADSGASDFQRLQNSMEAGKDDACVYVVFDAPFLSGYDLRKLGLADRKAILAAHLPEASIAGGRVRLSDHVVGQGPLFFQKACELGLEGILSKRADAPYVSKRTRSWLKVKCLSRQEFVIGGFTEPAGSRSHFGALLLGVNENDGLRYVGKVGTGFTADSLKEISKHLIGLERDESPFVSPPRGTEARGVHWLEPRLVAEVEFAEQTDEGRLRHASFKGLRDDKTPREVRPELPVEAPSSVDLSKIRLTHPDRILYPEQGITKVDLALYYAKVASRMLPHLNDRPLTLVRCPDGAGKDCFFQKHPVRGTSEAIGRFPITEKNGKGKKDYMVVRDVEGLIGLVQIGALEIHAWGSRTSAVEAPDQLTFDLDPDVGLPWERVAEGAEETRAALRKLGLTGFVKTTGGKGLHVVVPIVPDTPWDEAKEFCKAFVQEMARREPRKYVAVMTKEKRKGRIFLDYLRNARGATAVCAYSTHARSRAHVSVPVEWSEIHGDLRSDTFDIHTLPVRLESLKREPWAEFDARRTSIRGALPA